MAKYRKKPVEVEAIQFKITKEIPCKYGVAKEYNTDEIANFMGKITRTVYAPNNEVYFEIETLEGRMKAKLNDYIIKGVQGEFYPCKPDIFEATYEKVE